MMIKSYMNMKRNKDILASVLKEWHFSYVNSSYNTFEKGRHQAFRL